MVDQPVPPSTRATTPIGYPSRIAPSLQRRAFAPVDIASVTVFRVLFGAVMLMALVRFVAKDWIDELYVQPAYLFSYWGFHWLPRASEPALHALFAALAVLCAMIMVGLWYRAATVAFFLGFGYVELLDQSTYLNHYYFVSVVGLLMIFMPLAGALSLDARRRPATLRATVPAWVPWALRGQLGLVYLFAGLAKLHTDWLVHAQPLRIWLEARRDVPVVGPLLAHDGLALAMSWGGAAFDLTIFGWLCWRRTRAWAYAAVVGFHVFTGSLFQIGMFPWIMIAATTVFFEPGWPRRVLPSRWWPQPGPTAGTEPAASSEPAAGPEPAPAPPTAPPARQRLILAALALHFGVQLLVPLRGLLYPGRLAWHEQGFRFGWRVMLIEKTGMVELRVRDPATGRRWRIDPHADLTPLQVKMMSTQPQMILQYAHYVADQFARRGIPGVEVRADAWASLNGRRSQRLIDPDVDLADERDTLANKDWILPLDDRPVP